MNRHATRRALLSLGAARRRRNPVSPYPSGIAPFIHFKASFGVLNASDAAAANNDPVKTWNPFAGAATPCTQGTAANRCLFKTAIINGKPVLRFDGVNDFIDTGAGVWGAQAVGTVILVAAMSGVPAQVFYDHFGTRQQFYYDTANFVMYAGGTITGKAVDAAFHVFANVFAGDATSKNYCEATAITGNCGAGTATGVRFGEDTTGAAPAAMDLAEYKRFNQVLTYAQFKAEANALATTYALTSMT